MATWERLQSLGGDESRTKLQEIYTKFSFPIEVRGLFAEWIEEQEWYDNFLLCICNLGLAGPGKARHGLVATSVTRLSFLCDRLQSPRHVVYGSMRSTRW